MNSRREKHRYTPGNASANLDVYCKLMGISRSKACKILGIPGNAKDINSKKYSGYNGRIVEAIKKLKSKK
jgi:hypothetical protein